MSEQDQRGAEGLGVELVGEGDGGQVSAVPDEAGVLGVEDCLHLRSAVLVRDRVIDGVGGVNVEASIIQMNNFSYEIAD